MKITPDMVRSFATSLQDYDRKIWPRQIEAQAEVWGIRPNTIRRRLGQDAGLRLGAPKTGRKRDLSDDDVKIIMATVVRTERKGRYTLPLQRAVDLCWESGKLKCTRKPAVTTVKARAKELKISHKYLLTPPPHRTMRSLYGNHVWQLDVSLCVQYEFGPRGIKFKFEPWGKLDQVRRLKKAIHRWVIHDHATGAFYVYYFDSAGENIRDCLTFLFQAFGHKGDARLPFCGLPEILILDRGPAFISHAIRNLCKELEIDYHLHAPGAARTKGGVERKHWMWEREFEGRLRLQKIPSVEELNRLAQLETIKLCNDRIHGRTKMSRFGAWHQHVKKPVRLPTTDFDAFCWMAHGKPEDRQIKGDRLVWWKGKSRRVSDAHLPGEAVQVKPHPFEAGKFRVFQGDTELETTSPEQDDLGFPEDAPIWGEDFEPQPQTPAQILASHAKDLANFEQAYATEEDVPVESYGYDPLPYVTSGDVIEIEETLLSRMACKDQVIQWLGRTLSRDDGQWWNEAIDQEGITQTELEELYRVFTGQTVEAASA